MDDIKIDPVVVEGKNTQSNGIKSMSFFNPSVNGVSSEDLSIPSSKLSKWDIKRKTAAIKRQHRQEERQLNLVNKKEHRQLQKEINQRRRDTSNEAFGKFMSSDRASNILGSAANLVGGINSSLQNYTDTQQSLNSGIHSTMQAFGPWGMAVSAITGAADAAGATIGWKTDVLDSGTAARAGVSGANKATEMLSAIPGMGWIAGGLSKIGGKTIEGDKSAYIDGMASGYSKSVQDINASVAGGGKQMLFGKNKMNAFIQKQNEANDMITSIVMQSEMARNNDAAQLYQSQNFNKYSGNTPRLLMAKGGVKFQNLDSARSLLQRLTDKTVKGLDTKSLLSDIISLINLDYSGDVKNRQTVEENIIETIAAHKPELQRVFKKNGLEKYLSILENPNSLKNIQILGGILSNISQNKSYKEGEDISKFQLGGKIIDPSKNIIPAGALHKNRNHLSEYNEELQDQITEKGIPVVSEDKDGNITQHAEVEVGEVIFNLANTKIIEDYWQQYKETEDESIAIECGKFLVKELLHNTVDKAGIKKTVE